MIHDLCIIMLTAGITSLLFKLFKQPVVLGYIVAGILAGRYVFGSSWVEHAESVDTWGEIGVLFLLFSMGLEFSFKKLLKMGSTAVVAALVIVLGMMALGFLSGKAMGWSTMDSLFLGGMICMSSTTIVFKALEDLGLGKHHFASISFGILIVEDIFAVVLMVLLSSIAVKRSFEGMEMLVQMGKLVFYLILWFVAGIAIIPSFLRCFRKLLNDETLVIISIGLCLGMVLLASAAGFSAALGAFVMGSVLAETLEAERIEKLIKPVKDIFGAIFFVSVGMMINPQTLVEHWFPIVIITLLVIFGQIIFATAGTLISGQSLRVSIQTGFSLVQIGEFAFIIAQLGQQLGVTSGFLYPIVVAVSVITTFLTPYIMRLALPAVGFVERHSSPGFKLMLENYAKRRNATSEKGEWGKYLKKIVPTVVIHAIITISIEVLFFTYLFPLIKHITFQGDSHWINKLIAAGALLFIISPFVFRIVVSHRHTPEAQRLWQSGGLQKGVMIGLSIVRLLLGMSIVGYGMARIFTFTTGVIFILSGLLVFVMIISGKVRKRSSDMNTSFQRNLSARERSKLDKRAIDQSAVKSLLSYDVHISEFTIPPLSSFTGKLLKDLHIRNESGVSIVSIVRGGVHIFIPGGTERLFPGDMVVVAGSDEQIDKFQKMLDKSEAVMTKASEKSGKKHEVGLLHFQLSEGHPLVGRNILQSGVRERANCIIMGIEREGDYIMSPDPHEVMREGDILIIAGEDDKLRAFVSEGME